MTAPIHFQNTYCQLPGHFFTKLEPAKVPAPRLLKVNVELAKDLGIDTTWLESSEAVEVFSGNTTPTGAEPLAQAYAGHQFGGFVPQLGDGRAILLGEVVDRQGNRRDIQLKGSGITPFSRNGDGKSALGPVIREYIVSEAMYALGVPTTRALAAVATGETVLRQEGALPGGLFTRVAASHIRVGTFQYFAARRDTEAVRTLADYTIARHYPECLCTGDPSAPYAAFLTSVMKAQAKLVAQWMSLGFIHGVMNTDNCAISGETIDYGPCAFMDAFHPQCVFSSIDRQGRYAWGKQPEIVFWNLTRLAETLLPLLDKHEDKAVAMAEEALSGFSAYFSDQYMTRFRAKFGFTDSENDDLIQQGLSMLANQQVDFTLFFRHLTSAATGNDTGELASLFPDQEALNRWFTAWQNAAKTECGVTAMTTSNPILIPRNHRVEQAIQAAYAGDDTPFLQLVNALEKPYEYRQQYADFETPPTPDEIITETFCGT